MIDEFSTDVKDVTWSVHM